MYPSFAPAATLNCRTTNATLKEPAYWELNHDNIRSLPAEPAFGGSVSPRTRPKGKASYM